MEQNGCPSSAIYRFIFCYIDQVILTNRSKNASEILLDASLVAYFSFDNQSYLDSGPNHILGTAVNITSVSGRVNQAIKFNSSSSYFQVVAILRANIFQ